MTRGSAPASPRRSTTITTPRNDASSSVMPCRTSTSMTPARSGASTRAASPLWPVVTARAARRMPGGVAAASVPATRTRRPVDAEAVGSGRRSAGSASTTASRRDPPTAARVPPQGLARHAPPAARPGPPAVRRACARPRGREASGARRWMEAWVRHGGVGEPPSLRASPGPVNRADGQLCSRPVVGAPGPTPGPLRSPPPPVARPRPPGPRCAPPARLRATSRGRSTPNQVHQSRRAQPNPGEWPRPEWLPEIGT